jgi:hypothetical protein
MKCILFVFSNLHTLYVVIVMFFGKEIRTIILKCKNKFVVLLLTIVNSKVNARKAQKLDGDRRLKILSFGG